MTGKTPLQAMADRIIEGRIDACWMQRETPPPPSSVPVDLSAQSAYVETFWLPVVGPSSVLMLRRLHAWLVDGVEGAVAPIPAHDLAVCLGLGPGVAHNSPLVRTLARLAQFGLICDLNRPYLVVWPTVKPLSPRQLARLPEWLQATHPFHTLAEAS